MVSPYLSDELSSRVTPSVFAPPEIGVVAEPEPLSVTESLPPSLAEKVAEPDPLVASAPLIVEDQWSDPNSSKVADPPPLGPLKLKVEESFLVTQECCTAGRDSHSAIDHT